MKNILCEYIVVNIFQNKTEDEKKRQVNQKIKNLCVLDIEKNVELDYNVGVAFHGSVSDLYKGGTQ